LAQFFSLLEQPDGTGIRHTLRGGNWTALEKPIALPQAHFAARIELGEPIGKSPNHAHKHGGAIAKRTLFF
jgi:hypothetical protein